MGNITFMKRMAQTFIGVFGLLTLIIVLLAGLVYLLGILGQLLISLGMSNEIAAVLCISVVAAFLFSIVYAFEKNKKYYE